MSTKLVQITDLHLFEDPQGCLAGISTRDTFQAVLELIDCQDPDFDALVITGDIAQDELPGTYRALRQALGPRLSRCLLIPGNHDSRPALRQVFPELFVGNGERLNFRREVGGWKLLGLDSQVTGEVQGGLDPRQLEWLAGELSAQPDVPALLFVHHPPVAIGVPWLDEPRFRNAQALIQLVRDSPQIRAVSAGHVHQVFEGLLGDAAMLTTPSTCVQFAHSSEKAFDTATAGYRVFHLERGPQETPGRGTLRSEVHRLVDGP